MNKNSTIEIDGRIIGQEHPPYIIAELSANHNGDLNTALKLMELAKENGADAIKIQTYRADTLTINCNKPDFQIKGGLWHGKTLYELYESAHTPWEWHADLFAKAKALGITLFSSPFDSTAVDLLEELNTPAYKIASFELLDLPLIRYVAQTGKPMIMSTGMANDKEITDAVDAAYSAGCTQLVLLHCVSGYPASPEEYNLKTMADMVKRFDLPVGLSDHTLSNVTAITAVSIGAVVVEKHFTLDRSGGGPDDSFSMEPKDLKKLVDGAKTAWNSLGKVCYERKKSEAQNLVFRRSLYVVKPVKAGEVFSQENVRSIRPGYGLPPKEIEKVIGARARCDISLGTALQWEHFEDKIEGTQND